MNITYIITESSFRNIEKYKWLKDNFDIGKLGSKDDREIIRLLENSHYSNIENCLQLINDYGSQSEEIGENILNCNDFLSFGRYLSELVLFAYLFNSLGDKVKSVRRIEDQKTPDISIKDNDLEFLIEIYTPMDFYGYQAFIKLVSQSLKNLTIDLGFKITTKLKSNNFFYAYDFPNFKEVYRWIENYEKKTITWLNSTSEGSSFELETPAKSVKLITSLNKVYKDKNVRSILSNESTRSNDTKLFFEIEDPKEFAKTQWGVKIKDKLQRQQAGEKRNGVLRILAINFSYADTSDIDFFNSNKYYDNLVNDVKFLVSDITPYPPYDIVLPCVLRFDCGFIKPINLSDFDNSKIDELLSNICLNKLIEKMPQASKSEIDEIFQAMLELEDNNRH
ncbi:MAG: hypothetical protein KAW87_00315 [Candidatus Cloacimonetes bacterium]|nr:hypothetical protein [Candidatus Cloacimonadota bacterium]